MPKVIERSTYSKVCDLQHEALHVTLLVFIQALKQAGCLEKATAANMKRPTRSSWFNYIALLLTVCCTVPAADEFEKSTLQLCQDYYTAATAGSSNDPIRGDAAQKARSKLTTNKRRTKRRPCLYTKANPGVARTVPADSIRLGKLLPSSLRIVFGPSLCGKEIKLQVCAISFILTCVHKLYMPRPLVAF
jgi:hypothetical protein